MAKRFLRGVIQQANEDNMKLNNGIRFLQRIVVIMNFYFIFYFNDLAGLALFKKIVFFEIFNFTCLVINEMM